MIKVYALTLTEVDRLFEQGNNTFILDNDAWFNIHCKHDIDFNMVDVGNIIYNIDGVKCKEHNYCNSRFNSAAQMSVDNLSTGCKTVINVVTFKDNVFNITECGANALTCLFAYDISSVLITDCIVLPLNVDFTKLVLYTTQGHVQIKSREDFDNKVKRVFF